MNEKKLLELKQEIGKIKSETDELTGKRKMILENFKKEWNCKSLEEANTKLDEIRVEISDLKDKREKGVKKLQKELNL